MKKAKEYYSDIKNVLLSDDEEKIKEDLAEVFKALILEVEEIAKMRKAKTNGAWIAIINEQNNKWNAICSRAEKDGIVYLNRDRVKGYLTKELKLEEI